MHSAEGGVVPTVHSAVAGVGTVQWLVGGLQCTVQRLVGAYSVGKSGGNIAPCPLPASTTFCILIVQLIMEFPLYSTPELFFPTP